MQLDPRTMALYTAAIGVALAVLTLRFHRSQRAYAGFDLWVLALVTFSAALASIALRGVLPNAAVRFGPAGFGLLTVLSIVAGQDRFFARRSAIVPFLTAGVAGAAATLAADARGHDSLGQGLAAATVGGLLLAAALRFVLLAPPSLAAPARFCAEVLALLGVTRLWRAWLFLDAGPGYDVLLASTASSVNYAVNAVFVTLWSFAFTFLNAARLAADLETSRAELHQLAVTDSLTGLRNRRAFFADAEIELSRARRHSLPVSVLMLDVDHFKQVNDRSGHETGDRLLEAIGAVLLRELRASDVPARLGGEEFAILLAQTAAPEAAATAERLRAAVAGVRVGPADALVGATASIGVASATRHDDQLDELLRRADAALYEAKQSGRDRVVSC